MKNTEFPPIARPPRGIRCPICESESIHYEHVQCPIHLRQCDIYHYQPSCRNCGATIQRYDDGQEAHSWWTTIILGMPNHTFYSLVDYPVFDWGVSRVSLLTRQGSEIGYCL